MDQFEQDFESSTELLWSVLLLHRVEYCIDALLIGHKKITNFCIKKVKIERVAMIVFVGDRNRWSLLLWLRNLKRGKYLINSLLIICVNFIIHQLIKLLFKIIFHQTHYPKTQPLIKVPFITVSLFSILFWLNNIMIGFMFWMDLFYFL